MSNLSLEASIRTCKVDQGWAPRVQTDRFFNPNVMVCPVWNGLDNAGRSVDIDSFVTKTAGCNSALDRVNVENDQRPQYMEYVNLSAQGFGANLYPNKMSWKNQGNSNTNIKDVRKDPGFGNFGLQMNGNTYPGCAYSQYDQAMSQMAQNKRAQQVLQEGYYSNMRRRASGF